MNKQIISLLMMTFILLSSLSATESKQKSSPAGSWKFEAPYAPEGFTAGKIEVGMTGNDYTALISFAGNDYKIKGEKVKFVNDILSFNVFIEGNDVTISLKMENPSKMTGKAVYYEGEIPVNLVREQQTK